MSAFGKKTSDHDVSTFVSDSTRAVHMIGVGGMGMAGVAYQLFMRGFHVTGSDAYSSRVTDWLQRKGIQVHIGHAEQHLSPEVDWVIKTSAIPASHVELQAACLRDLPVFARGAVLSALLDGHRSVVVCGTHGKTTTAAMITTILREAGRDPSHCIGGEAKHLGGVAHVGRGCELIVEADESDGTLAHYRPDLAVVTNIEFDHMDYFKNEVEYEQCFEIFVKACRDRIVYWRDDPIAHKLVGTRKATTSFGVHPQADLRLLRSQMEPMQSHLWLGLPGGDQVCVVVPLPGMHNVWNAVAACTVGHVLGLEPSELSRLHAFRSVRRRFDVLLDGDNVMVVSDYAHHPTEIQALLTTAAGLGRSRIIMVFQPHRYTRTRILGAQFPLALSSADHLILVPVYTAFEEPVAGGTTDDLWQHMEVRQRERVELADSLDDAWARLVSVIQPGDLLLVVGAGDVESLAFRAREQYGT